MEDLIRQGDDSGDDSGDIVIGGGIGFGPPEGDDIHDHDDDDNDTDLLPPPPPAGTRIQSERVSPVDTPTTINDPYYLVIGRQAPAA